MPPWATQVTDVQRLTKSIVLSPALKILFDYLQKSPPSAFLKGEWGAHTNILTNNITNH